MYASRHCSLIVSSGSGSKKTGNVGPGPEAFWAWSFLLQNTWTKSVSGPLLVLDFMVPPPKMGDLTLKAQVLDASRMIEDFGFMVSFLPSRHRPMASSVSFRARYRGLLYPPLSFVDTWRQDVKQSCDFVGTSLQSSYDTKEKQR